MAQQPGSTNNGHNTKRLLIALISMVLIGLIIGIGTWTLYSNHLRSGSATQPKTTATAGISIPSAQATPSPALSGPVSPLIFGTNVALFDQKDRILNSADARTMLQQMHATIIRMPTRQSTLTLDLEVQMAKIIQSLGASPLIILQGPSEQNPLDYNMRLVQAMNGVFGTSTVYYEYSNEEDYFHHLSAQDYVNDWNATIPTLKRLAPNAKFIGPVTSIYKQNYLTTFLQQANPQPDAISWHEYTCDRGDDPTTCINNIDNWTQHIANARATMQSTVGKVYPIMITEWNYAGNADPNDGKDGNAQFMTTWTTKALQTLAANRIFASMQYSATNTYMSLIDNNNAYTPQGAAFRNEYQQMIIDKQQPAAVSPSGQ